MGTDPEVKRVWQAKRQCRVIMFQLTEEKTLITQEEQQQDMINNRKMLHNKGIKRNKNLLISNLRIATSARLLTQMTTIKPRQLFTTKLMNKFPLLCKTTTLIANLSQDKLLRIKLIALQQQLVWENRNQRFLLLCSKTPQI